MHGISSWIEFQQKINEKEAANASLRSSILDQVKELTQYLNPFHALQQNFGNKNWKVQTLVAATGLAGSYIVQKVLLKSPTGLFRKMGYQFLRHIIAAALSKK